MPADPQETPGTSWPLWNVESLKEYFDATLAATDKRYAERYEASQVALQAALVGQEKAVNTALLAAEKAVGAALTAAKEAVTKAEIASEKRFDNVNEFRGTLADQQRTLMPRAEAEALNRVLAEKIDTLAVLVQTMNAERNGARQFGGDIGPYLLAGISVVLTIFLHYVK